MTNKKRLQKETEPDKLRIMSWFDTQKRKPFYGVDIKINHNWYHVAVDGVPLFFDLCYDAVGFIATQKET